MRVTNDGVVITMTQQELSRLVDDLTTVCAFVDEIVTPSNTAALRNANAALQDFHRRLCDDDIKDQLRRALSQLPKLGD